MLELRLLKVYQIIHKSIRSPCGLNQTVSLQLNIFQLTHHRFYSASSPAWQSIYLTSLGAFRESIDNSSTKVLPGVSKTAYGSGNLFMAKHELLKCLPVKKCQAFCSWRGYLRQFSSLPSDLFSSIMFIPNYSRCFSVLLHVSMY